MIVEDLAADEVFFVAAEVYDVPHRHMLVHVSPSDARELDQDDNVASKVEPLEGDKLEEEFVGTLSSPGSRRPSFVVFMAE
jgi:hypothetical protein